MFKKYKKRILGRRYEGYIAWLLKQQGWDVVQRGKYGVYDRGIDLTATRNGVTRYIQCKNWSKKREIHENIVDQFYGAVMSANGHENLQNIEMYIYSTVKPSLVSAQHAADHNILFEQVAFPFFSRRKKRISSLLNARH